MNARTLALALALCAATAGPAVAQSIAPHHSALFRAPPATPIASDSAKTEPFEPITPIVLGGVAGALASGLFVADSDGPTGGDMLTGAVIGAGVALVMSLVVHAMKQ